MTEVRARLGVLLALLLGAGPAVAQSGTCFDTDPLILLPGTCSEVVAAVQGVQAGTGLALTGANPLTGGASTLGRRFGATPRVALTGRLGLTRFPLPRVGSSGPSDARALTPSLYGTATVGLFDGFAPVPTVGGLLSLDLFAGASAAFLPDGEGFDGAVSAWTFGARVGVLRESFTLPGVTLSVSQTRSGSVGLGADAGPEPRFEMDVTTTSLRGVVGKELLGAGVLVGAGWDRYESDGRYRIRQSLGGPVPVEVAFRDQDSSRVLFFGGVSRTILVVQFAGEVGWAQGFDDLSPAPGSFDPTAGTLFGVFSLRLTI